MSTDSEDSELLAFLSCPASYDGSPARIEIIETHAARVFLAGSKAFKVKKRVTLPFLDFSTLASRRQALQRELDLNQAHAPQIYLSLIPIGRGTSGALAFGDGTPIDYALEMNRFDQANLLAEIACRGPLPSDLSRDLASMAAGYHRSSPVRTDTAGSKIMETTIQGLAAALTHAAPEVLLTAASAFHTRSLEELDRVSGLLDLRSRRSHVRRCHGDLHLGNIVVIAGRPVPFDALEFDEALATIDVLYDLAFLIMDLHTRGDRRAANIVLNRYILEEPTGDEIDGLAALPLFLSTRAAVRALVAAERIRQQNSGTNSGTGGMDHIRLYLDAANAFLKPAEPILIGIGGHSGTGKSTLAAALAPTIGPAPGALHLRSDIERKKLFGVPEIQRLPQSAYTQSTSDNVYAILYDKTQRALAAGHSAIVDGVSMKREERSRIEAVAGRAGCRFRGFWLEAPLTTKLERVEARRGDASDADVSVVRAQDASDDDGISWSLIDAGGTPEETLARARALLAQ